MKIKTLLSLMTLSVLLVSCDSHDDHEPPRDTSMRFGDIVCSDGSVVRYEECVSMAKTPTAVVFHVNNDGYGQGKGYAVCLNEITDETFADSLGISQGTSADITAYDGNSNTYSMYKSRISPAAESVFGMWKYGQSAYIPSVAEMRLIYTFRTVLNEYIEKCGGEIISDDPDECWYWTSTEVEGQELHKAWLYSLSTGAMQETPKDECHKIRPVITIYE